MTALTLRRWAQLLGLLLLLVLPLCVRAWPAGLKEAAMAVAQGKATKADELLIYVHNHDFQLMAQSGELGDFTYAGAQSRFQEIHQKILDDTFKNSPYRAEVSKAKLNPGTDTDVNVFRADGKPMTLDDIQAVEARYQRTVRTHFDGESIPSGRIDTKTDFMPHPAHTTPEEFKRIAAHINANGGAAYTSPGAASAQAKLGSPAKITLQEAGAFQAEMKTLAEARMTSAADLRRKAASIGGSNPGEVARLNAQAAQYEYQAAKYHERMSALNNHLRGQFGLGAEKGVMDDVAKTIANIGRNAFSSGQLGAVRELHPKAMQNASEHLLNTLMEIARKEPATLAQVRALVNAEVRALHAAGAPRAAAQAAIRMEQTVKHVEAAAKWAAYKQTGKNLVTKIPVMAIAGGALLGYQGVQISLSDVKATDTVWDFIRNCYYHAAWEGTGIGTAFEQAQREEIERYLKEFETGADPSMTKHVTFTLLKTGVYLGRDMIIGVLTLPDVVWEYFTQEKEMEGYAAMQNELARVMRQMINDRKAFDDLMARMRKLGLRDEDARYFLDCMCRECGGMLGGLYNPSFKSDIGHGPCQCNGPLNIWKTPLPVGNKDKEYACFNAVTRMRYDQAQDIFDKWHQQALQANALSVAAELDGIKQEIARGNLENDEERVRDLADRFTAIQPLLMPDDADWVKAMIGPHLVNHAYKQAEAGNLSRAVENMDKALDKVGIRGAQNEANFRQQRERYKAWGPVWKETEEKRLSQIDAMLGKRQIQQARGHLEVLEYQMIKDPTRPLPPAIRDPDFVRLKTRLHEMQSAYNEALATTWKTSSDLQKARDMRAAIPVLERMLNDWEHRDDTAQNLRGQIAYDRAQVAKADELRGRGQAAEAERDLAQAIGHYTASLDIQRDEGLQAHVARLQGTQADQQARKAQAQALRSQAQAQQQQGRIPEAIAGYKQSLALWPDPQLQAFVTQLEQVWVERQARQSQAQQMRNQAQALQQQGRVAEAIARYRQSLSIWPDPELEAFVRRLEVGQSQASALPGPAPTGTPAPGSTPAPAPAINPVGVWRHEPSATWAIRRLPSGQYQADETGLGYASGPGQFTASGSFRIDYVTRDGAIKGIYEVVFDATGRSASGTVRELTGPMRSGKTQWTRISDLPPATGVASAPPAPVVQTIGNVDAVSNNPTRPSTFTLSEPRVLTLLQTYHWNHGRGATPGTIALRDEAGRQIGPWRASGSPGQGGVPNAYWNTRPNMTLPAGTYTVIDSDPSTWAQNTRSGGAGHMRIETQAVGAIPSAAPAVPPAPRANVPQALPIVGRWKTETIEEGKVEDVSYATFRADGSYTLEISPDTLAGTAECTLRGQYRLSGGILQLLPESHLCRFQDGNTRSEPVGRDDSVSGPVAGDGRAFTFRPQGTAATVRFTRLDGTAAPAAVPARAPVASSDPAPVAGRPSAGQPISAEVHNTSREAVHIVADGMAYGPANRLLPGEKRVLQVTPRADGSVTFLAGRNGQTLATKVWQGVAGDRTRVPVVTFDESNPFEKLAVATGLR
jgi:tetratricopeptide (TPR) repeat protein